MRIPIGKLITPITEIKVSPTTPLDEALTKMSINRLSALPVVDETEALQGVVTVFAAIQAWKSSSMLPHELIVNSATIEYAHRMRPEPVTIDADLYDHITPLVQSTHDYLCVINNESEKRAIGIVSKVRLLDFLFTMNKPYILAKEIEANLKEHIKYAYQDEETLEAAIANLNGSAKDINNKALILIKKLCADKQCIVPDNELEGRVRNAFPLKTGTRTLRDLTFSELIQLIQNQVAWAELGPIFTPYTTKGWTNRVLPALGARNDIFHFRKDIDPQAIDDLTDYADWLNTYLVLKRPKLTIQLAPAAHSEADVTEAYKYFIQSLEAGKLANSTQIQSISTIKSIVSFILPLEAETNALWWQTDSVYTRQWIDKGWTVVDVDIEEGYITFSATAKS